MNPPMNPMQLLFGLAFTIPRLLFPNKTPKNHAMLSHIKTIRIKTQTAGTVIFFPSRVQVVILEVNVSKNPVYVIIKIEEARRVFEASNSFWEKLRL